MKRFGNALLLLFGCAWGGMFIIASGRIRERVANDVIPGLPSLLELFVSLPVSVVMALAIALLLVKEFLPLPFNKKLLANAIGFAAFAGLYMTIWIGIYGA